MGKESNKLEESNILGVDEDGYQIYDAGKDLIEKYGKDFLLSIGPKKVRKLD